jgi:RNA polymerase sigma-70 factor, ECF subfamily
MHLRQKNLKIFRRSRRIQGGHGRCRTIMRLAIDISTERHGRVSVACALDAKGLPVATPWTMRRALNGAAQTGIVQRRMDGKRMLDHPETLSRALSGCARGERDALRIIFESEAGRLVAVAERITRRRDLAEEVVQEAFIQIWRKAHQYEPERGSAKGWIYAIVRNRALNLVRDGRRIELPGEESLEQMQEAAPVELADSAYDALDSQSRLRACLSGLDEAKRRSILMAYISGYTHGEIAGRMRVPLGTAKAWIRRGLAALRECMR